MYSQNPVFIPGPTNMPEVLRKASDLPTIDHRSEHFGDILQPALAGVKKVMKSEKRLNRHLSGNRDRRMGGGYHQHAQSR